MIGSALVAGAGAMWIARFELQRRRARRAARQRVQRPGSALSILHVIGSIDPAKGGPQTVVVRMAAAQAALGHAVTIASYSSAAIERKAWQAAAGVPHVGSIRWVLLRDPSRLEHLFALGGRRLMRQVVADADFVHIHGVWEPFLLAGAALARESGVPYCVRPAGMLDRWSLAQKSWKKQLALRLGYRRMLDGAAFIQVLNHDEAAVMGLPRLRPPRVVIPNGIFLEEIAPLPQAQSFRASVPGLGTRPFVLFLSRLHPKKGLDVLAEAYARAAPQTEADLVVAGPEDGAGADFARRVAASGLADRVHMVGPLFGTMKFAALAEAACFCLPSRQEGFSLAITEALACGVPALVSEACHFPEVGFSGAGLVLALDAAAFAAGMLRVLGEPGLAASMGANGRTLIAARFTWPKIAEATVAAYAAARQAAMRPSSLSAAGRLPRVLWRRLLGAMR